MNKQYGRLLKLGEKGIVNFEDGPLLFLTQRLRGEGIVTKVNPSSPLLMTTYVVRMTKVVEKRGFLPFRGNEVTITEELVWDYGMFIPKGGKG